MFCHRLNFRSQFLFRPKGHRYYSLGGILLILTLLSFAAIFGSSLMGVEMAEFEEARRHLQVALDRDRPAEIEEAVASLAQSADPRAVRLLAHVADRYPTSRLHGAVAAALQSQNSMEWIAALGRQLRSAKSDAEAILMIRSLGGLGTPAAGEPLLFALQSSRPNVLIAAVRAARKLETREVVKSCIEVLARVEEDASTLWAETRITLQALTGEQFRQATDWLKWFESRSSDWQPKASRGAEKNSRTSVYRPVEKDGLGLPRLFGQEIASKRVVFVIDCSRSMEKVDPTEGGGEEGSKGTAGPTRLQRAQKELIQAIDQLRPDVRFNVIAYSTRVTPWVSEKLIKAKKSARRKSALFVGAMRPDETTNSGEALLMALSLPAVDTVIFLSDGSPTVPGEGKLAETQPIIDAVMEANRDKNVTIHTLGFEGAKVSFMRALADGTGGTYAEIR